MTKRTKADVRYEHPAKIPSHNCGRCVHFEPPSSCEKVAGKIGRADWCKLWRLK